MHILIAAIGLLGAAAFWWYRMKAMNDAAREVADVVGRVQGNIRRKRLRKQAALSPLTAIDDPVVAAATLITAIIAENGPVLSQREAVIRSVISEIADDKKTMRPWPTPNGRRPRSTMPRSSSTNWRRSCANVSM
ncbi:hypothetical protein [Mesorhizobium sp.]|uniref:hypothetical protein n=1 Tax=Mesorhizobium sp. TaxID=1871066 RepID=UPI00258BEB57|nr:hypothetical protein [Mesorhizobium sp.]